MRSARALPMPRVGGAQIRDLERILIALNHILASSPALSQPRPRSEAKCLNLTGIRGFRALCQGHAPVPWVIAIPREIAGFLNTEER